MNAPPASPSDDDGREDYTETIDSVLVEISDSGTSTKTSSEDVINTPPGLGNRQGNLTQVSPPPPQTERPPLAYEERMKQDRRWGFMEGSMHFERGSAVHKTLERIVKRLDDLGIPYAIAGAMAMFFHGYERFTVDVDLLVTPEGLKRIHEHLEGLGYVPLFAGSKHLRDAHSGVKIEFLTAGDYPGDGKPKPVSFPDPTQASVEIQGMHFLSLPALVELKLASGMTNPSRLKDLADVQEMIKVLNLPDQLAEQMNPFVRDKYKELWTAVRNNPTEI